MCYDISFSTRIEMLTDYFQGLEIDPQAAFDFDRTLHVQAQAHRKYPVVLMDDGKYKLKPFEWGIIPDYMDTPEKIKKGRSSMCNARSEKLVDDKKSWWHRIRKNRCLIPVTGIFEHREVKGWKNKVPYHVQLKERNIFCIPGLYYYPHRADVETGEITGTFTLITRGANSLMSQIHNSGDQAFRMPLFLPRELENEWLQPTLSDDQIAQILHFEMPSEKLDADPVYTIRTTKERPDSKEKTAHFDWPGLPPLGIDSIELSLF